MTGKRYPSLSDPRAYPQHGWRDTERFGLICPDCLAKHPELGRLKEHTVPTP